MAFSVDYTAKSSSYLEIYSSSEGSEREFSDADDSFDNGTDSGRRRAAHSSSGCRKACIYYNKGYCKNVSDCPYLHICQYFLKGACRYGSACPLRHTAPSQLNESARNGRSRRRRTWKRDSSLSHEQELRDGCQYQWQIHSNGAWEDIANDHIIEAQYSRPNIKGINIYNTYFGTICIDFNQMQVLKKTSLKVRRLSSSQVQWIWYYHGDKGWVQYGTQDSNGKSTNVNSTQIEREFQKNHDGFFRFAVDTTKYEIQFQEMHQENLRTRFKRRVVRRPDFPSNRSSTMQGLRVSAAHGRPTWEFEGDNGNWCIFQHRSRTSADCSSANVEAQYQQNPRGYMDFTLGSFCYRLDFSAMTQTNLTTKRRRRIRRVEC